MCQCKASLFQQLSGCLAHSVHILLSILHSVCATWYFLIWYNTGCMVLYTDLLFFSVYLKKIPLSHPPQTHRSSYLQYNISQTQMHLSTARIVYLYFILQVFAITEKRGAKAQSSRKLNTHKPGITAPVIAQSTDTHSHISSLTVSKF